MSNPYRDRLLSIGMLKGGRTRDVVRDGRRSTGERCKATTDELGNTVVESTERQDVVIKAPLVKATLSQREVRE